MITCDLSKDFGIALFQIFGTIAFAMKNRLPFIFPYDSLEYWNDPLLSFIKRFTSSPENFPNNSNIHDLVYQHPTFQLDEEYTEIPSTTNNVMFKGNFDRYLYFENEFSQIIKFMNIKLFQMKNKSKYIEHFKKVNIGIGIKKDVPFTYYQKAIEAIHMNIDNVNSVSYITVIPNDCEDSMNIVNQIEEYFDIKVTNITNLENKSDDMLLLSNCEYTIVCHGDNTSLWGGYFNINGHVYINDLGVGHNQCPCDWIKIDTD